MKSCAISIVILTLAAVSASAQQLQPAEPMLVCNDVARQIEFYTQKLGFGIEAQYPEDGPTWARLTRGNCKIMFLAPLPYESFQTQWKELENKPKGLANWLIIRVTDVDELYEEFKRKAVPLGEEYAEGPVDRPWGAREFVVLDPEGFFLVFSQQGN